MHRLLAVAAVVLAASPALAQPEMRAEMCGVTFVRAPDDVRYVIERWLRAEPHCSAQIELRVVPTEGGYYLLAVRPDGRIHERFVPDAQSAGVLVASWVADDWTAPPPPPEPPAPPPLTVIVDPLRVGAPGTIGVATRAAPAPERGPGKWLSLGLELQPDTNAGGFRAEGDVINVGNGWKLGAQVSYSESNEDLMESEGWTYGFMTMKDLKVMGTFSHTWRADRWELRAGIGFGAIRTRAYIVGDASNVTTSGLETYDDTHTFPSGEVSALLTRRIGDSWGLGIGPVFTIIDQHFDAAQINGKIERSTTQFMMFGGLRYEL